jgi:hypothetical protein
MAFCRSFFWLREAGGDESEVGHCGVEGGAKVGRCVRRRGRCRLDTEGAETAQEGSDVAGVGER